MTYILRKTTAGGYQHYFIGQVTDTVNGNLFSLGDLTLEILRGSVKHPMCSETSLSPCDAYQFNSYQGASFWTGWLVENGIGGADWEIFDLYEVHANSNVSPDILIKSEVRKFDTFVKMPNGMVQSPELSMTVNAETGEVVSIESSPQSA